MGVLDSLVQVNLHDGRLDDCRIDLEQYGTTIRTNSLPSRSWYDLAHDVTRCAFYERLGEWERIVASANRRSGGARRQYKAIRTSLLCAPRAPWPGSPITTPPTAPSAWPCGLPARRRRSAHRARSLESLVPQRARADRRRRSLRPRARRLPRHRSPLSRSLDRRRTRDESPARARRAQPPAIPARWPTRRSSSRMSRPSSAPAIPSAPRPPYRRAPPEHELAPRVEVRRRVGLRIRRRALRRRATGADGTFSSASRLRPPVAIASATSRPSRRSRC